MCHLNIKLIYLFTDPLKRTEADNIQAAWSDLRYEPSEAELKTAAQLAQEGYLSSVKNMQIENKNISEISTDNMSKLASILTDTVYITNITPVSQLGTILASVQSELLWLGHVSLSEENTQALVTAMRTRVQTVAVWSGLTLDPELLSAYDGQGHCNKLVVMGRNKREKYGTRLKRWARDRGWTVTKDSDEFLKIERT